MWIFNVTIQVLDKAEKKNSLYFGEDCVKSCISVFLLENMQLPVTEKEHQDWTVCYTCQKKKPLPNNKNWKVKEHCYFTGKYKEVDMVFVT